MHRHAGPGQVQLVGNIGGKKILVVAEVGRADGEVVKIRIAIHEVRQITRRHPATARKNAHILRTMCGVARIFQGFPRTLQQQPQLWIHQFRITRRYLEEAGIELVDII
ncbi:hypothetical protein GCM10027565_16020 [Bordetella tumulicola]